MSQAAAITATLGIERGKFKTELEAAKGDLGGLKAQATTTAGAIALLEREMRGGASEAQRKQITALKTEFRELTREIKTTEAQINALGAAGGGNTGGLQLAKGKKLRKGVMGLEQAAFAAAEGGDAAQVATGAVAAGAMSLQLGLAPMIGIAAGLGITKKLIEARQEAVALKKELATIGQSTGGTSGDTVDGLEKALEATRANKEKMGEQSTSFFNAVLQTYSGGSAGISQKDIAQAEQLERNLRDRQNVARARDQGLNRRAFENGDESVAQDRLKEQYEQARKAIKPGEGAAEEGRILKQKFELEKEILARREAGQERALALEERLLAIRNTERNVAVEEARARTEAARAAVAAGPQSGREHRRNVAAAGRAAQDLADAELARDNQNAGDALDFNVLGLRGSAQDISRERNRLEAEEIERQRNDPRNQGTDRMTAIRKRAGANLAERDALDRADAQRNLAAQDDNIESAKGRGPAQEVWAIDAHLQVLKNRRKANRDTNGDDAGVNAQLDRQQHDLLRQKDDILFTENQSLAAAKSHTAQMDLQLSGQSRAAQAEAARLSYEQQIAAAIRDGKTELAEQLKIQQKLTATEEAVRREMLGPQGRAQEDEKERAKARARYAVENRGARSAEADAANNRDNPLLDKLRRRPAPDRRGQATANPKPADPQPKSAADAYGGPSAKDIGQEVATAVLTATANPNG